MYYRILTGGLLLLAVLLSATQEEEPATRAQLGKKLFFDPILSADRTISCASCHQPRFAFADTAVFSQGINGKLTVRNTPGITNLAGRPNYFWDGRAATLEEQAKQPIISPDEMGLPIAEAVIRLNAEPAYVNAFRKIFNSDPSEQALLQAIAAYERTLETANSPYDRYINGDDNAMSASAIRGRLLFIGKANCSTCHSGEDFTADRFKNIGLYNGKELRDAGRYGVTKDSAHMGFFKVPGLRNVAVTAPYMHNGMFRTLREVIEYYNSPDRVVSGGIKRDLSLGAPLQLTGTDMDDLESFLQALTDDQFSGVHQPK
ncbi:cytochrome-c peroxidase [Chitinophaga pendula]|uniref:cytochrome-c peroxidase n=1 Tax=Chitinophaga TaxID=79328 RepID=UPI000BAFD8CD|nr:MULTISPECIES: cytochrome c peroxidase [Chitinophaga]ASZ09950.1 cytochrome-c peroxidase [Chitinophaga sp. MD30]UCJ07108.1 cytochrome-c peroxidase [Chitinophaga pendula]